MPLPGLSADFNEPQDGDPTSAPPMPNQQQPQQGQQGLAQALARRKKKGLAKPPSTLAAAISKARRGRPSADKYG
jgi:hypothetical protein